MYCLANTVQKVVLVFLLSERCYRSCNSLPKVIKVAVVKDRKLSHSFNICDSFIPEDSGVEGQMKSTYLGRYVGTNLVLTNERPEATPPNFFAGDL